MGKIKFSLLAERRIGNGSHRLIFTLDVIDCFVFVLDCHLVYEETRVMILDVL